MANIRSWRDTLGYERLIWYWLVPFMNGCLLWGTRNSLYEVQYTVFFPRFSGFGFHRKTHAHKKTKSYRQSKQIECLYSIFVGFILRAIFSQKMFQLPFSPPPPPDHAATPVRAGTRNRTRMLSPA